MATRLQQGGREDYQSLTSVEHLNQFNEEERKDLGEDRPLSLERNDFSFSSNIAVATEGDTGVNRSRSKNEPGSSSNTSNASDRLCFSKKGDHLSITFVQAELKENYGSYKMDPYCVMKVGSDVLKTDTCRNGSTNPRWGTQLESQIPPSVCYVFIEIFDQHTFQADEKIAWTSIPIKRLVEGGDKAADWFDLSGRQGWNSEGKLQLITTYTPNNNCRIPEPLFLSALDPPTVAKMQQRETSQANIYPTETVLHERSEDKLSDEVLNSTGGNLKITCIKAQLQQNYGLLPMDPYCVIEVGSHRFKTTVCPKSSTKPEWNNNFERYLPSGACMISIEIFDEKTLSQDTKIAWTSILMKEIVQVDGETTNWYLLSGEQGKDKEGKIQLSIKYEKPSVDNDDEGMIPLDKVTTFLNIGKRSLSDYTGKVPGKVNIILVGRGGNGKSSVGNTILGRQCFSTKEGQNTLQLEKLQKRNFEVNVMDTPNLFDHHQEMEIEQQTMEMVKTAMDFPGGIHLFVIVCRGDVRLKDEERKMLAEFEKKYGKDANDHLLLVLTHASDSLRHKSLDEVLKTNEDLWNLCTYVRGRVIAIENIYERLSDLTIEDQQTQLLRTIFEVIRMQHPKSYDKNFFHAANEQIVQKERKHKGIVQAYDSIFDHAVNTVCGKNATNLCEILKTKYFAIDDHILTSSNARPSENIIRQCTEWCIKDLETFINLALTEKRLKYSSDEGDEKGKSNPLIETYKKRSLRTSKLIKLNRQKLMLLFSTDVEEKVRSFLRRKELSEINQIMTDVQNDITQCEIYDAILEALPKYFKSEEWAADVKYLGLQNVNEYLEMKTKMWSNPLFNNLRASGLEQMHMHQCKAQQVLDFW